MSEARRIRSPNYPALSLAEAIARITPVYERERQHPMSRDVALKGLGYNTPNGAALGCLSAVAKYGLLDKTGETYRVSARTVVILHPANPEEKASALRQAAFAPALFGELAEQFPGGQVSDDNLRSYLIRREFSSGAVAGVITAFRDTMQMVSSTEEKTPSQLALPAPPVSPGPAGRHHVMHTPSPAAPTVPAFAGTATPWLVSLDGQALTIQARLDNGAAVDKLIAVLQATKVLLPNVEIVPVARQADDDEAQH